MKTANIGMRIVAEVEFDIDKIERESGVVSVSGFVDVTGKRRWISIPLDFCEEVVELGNGGEVIENINPEDGRVDR